MQFTVKRDFDYSADGLTLKRLQAGEIHEISDSLSNGLFDAGLIEPIAEEIVEAQPVVARHESAPRQHFDDRRRQGRR
jgi:hypothetical protein